MFCGDFCRKNTTSLFFRLEIPQLWIFLRLIPSFEFVVHLFVLIRDLWISIFKKLRIFAILAHKATVKCRYMLTNHTWANVAWQLHYFVDTWNQKGLISANRKRGEKHVGNIPPKSGVANFLGIKFRFGGLGAWNRDILRIARKVYGPSVFWVAQTKED